MRAGDVRGSTNCEHVLTIRGRDNGEERRRNRDRWRREGERKIRT